MTSAEKAVPAAFKKPVEAKSTEYVPTLFWCDKCNTGLWAAFPGQYNECKCGELKINVNNL